MEDERKKPLLHVCDLTIGFEKENTRTNVVNHISFDVMEGEILGIVGESGSGKSITSHSIISLLPQNPTIYDGAIVFSRSKFARTSSEERCVGKDR